MLPVDFGNVQFVYIFEAMGKLFNTARFDGHVNFSEDRPLELSHQVSGRQDTTQVKGFFDLIGMVQPRVDEKGGVVYPPMVTFESDGSFVVKYTGSGKF